MNESDSIKDDKATQSIQRFVNLPPSDSKEVSHNSAPIEPIHEKDFEVKPLSDEEKKDDSATGQKGQDEGEEKYYSVTHDYLIRERKERNAIILKIDKLEDERIEKGSDEYDDTAREITKLQNDLWHKNNLIEALAKVLISLAR